MRLKVIYMSKLKISMILYIMLTKIMILVLPKLMIVISIQYAILKIVRKERAVMTLMLVIRIMLMMHLLKEPKRLKLPKRLLHLLLFLIILRIKAKNYKRILLHLLNKILVQLLIFFQLNLNINHQQFLNLDLLFAQSSVC